MQQFYTIADWNKDTEKLYSDFSTNTPVEKLIEDIFYNWLHIDEDELEGARLKKVQETKRKAIKGIKELSELEYYNFDWDNHYFNIGCRFFYV